MFICDFCHVVTEPKEKLTRVVTKTRAREYVNTDEASGIKTRTKGTEIVKEVNCCSVCAEWEKIKSN